MSPAALLLAETERAIEGTLDRSLVLSQVKKFLEELVSRENPFGDTGRLEAVPPRDKDFIQFWQSLPKEMKIGKADCQKAYRQMYSVLPPVSNLIAIVTRQVQIRRQTGQGFLHPATFLRKKRWEDKEEALLAFGGQRGRIMVSGLDNDERFMVASEE